MIHSITRFLLAAVFTLSAILPAQAAEKLILDDQHSYVLWHINHLGFTTQSGKWYVKGFVLLDKDHPQNSKVEATIDLNNFVTGLPELDKHLKSPLFFDTAKYPTATFISSKVDVINDHSARVEGSLTLHGITKPVTLDVTLNKTGKNPITDKMTVGFSAKTELKRSDFGMKALLPNLGDEVTIEIGAEAYQPAA
ncbi:YceI family protein [Legionella sp. CNM-4043-24]|uniref:YceI family protein n=1 Tax=Legionella sp. CNM-4043-24 TaxID=3421646 RepID=UPI00403AECC4